MIDSVCMNTRLGKLVAALMLPLKRVSPSAERNRDPILGVLRSSLAQDSPLNCLEIASGCGTHVGHFARHLPHVTWQPTDLDTENLESLRAYKSEHTNILEPLVLDISNRVELENFRPDFLLCINMIHISPWAATLGLFANAGRLLSAGAPARGPHHPGLPTEETRHRHLRLAKLQGLVPRPSVQEVVELFRIHRSSSFQSYDEKQQSRSVTSVIAIN